MCLRTGEISTFLRYVTFPKTFFISFSKHGDPRVTSRSLILFFFAVFSLRRFFYKIGPWKRQSPAVRPWPDLILITLVSIIYMPYLLFNHALGFPFFSSKETSDLFMENKVWTYKIKASKLHAYASKESMQKLQPRRANSKKYQLAWSSSQLHSSLKIRWVVGQSPRMFEWDGHDLEQLMALVNSSMCMT